MDYTNLAVYGLHRFNSYRLSNPPCLHKLLYPVRIMLSDYTDLTLYISYSNSVPLTYVIL